MRSMKFQHVTCIYGGVRASFQWVSKGSLPYGSGIYSVTKRMSRIHPGSSAKQDRPQGNQLGSWFSCPWQGRGAGFGNVGKTADWRCIAEIKLAGQLQSGREEMRL